MADILNNSLDEWFPEESDITILADPGIFITTSAFTLATRINSVSRSTINDGHIKYFINDGIDGSFKIIHYDGLVSVVPKPLKVSYTISYLLFLFNIVFNMIMLILL